MLIFFTHLACKGFEQIETNFSVELNDISGYEIEKIPSINGAKTPFISNVEFIKGLMNIES